MANRSLVVIDGAGGPPAALQLIDTGQTINGQPVYALATTGAAGATSGAAADGVAPVGNPVLVAGQDGANVQTLLTDTAGRPIVVTQSGLQSPSVQGVQPAGSVLAGNPVQIGGSDGTNVRNLATDTTGQLKVVQVGAAGALPPVELANLLPSAVRTTATNTATQTNTLGYHGVMFYLSITAASGTGGIFPVLFTIDPGGTNAFQQMTVAGTPIIAVGLYLCTYYPAALAAPYVGQNLSMALPRTWLCSVQHQNGTNYTYSLSACLLP